MRRFLSFLLVVVLFQAHSQIPDGYYSAATGSGYTLKTQLHNIIDDHTDRGYNWTFFNAYDIDSYYENDGSILDIYSENPSGSDPYNFVSGPNQCGNYSDEGDCYNREHSFPKSWFNDGYPMYSDVHHLFATDGKVNSIRSNYPFGEVGSASYTSQNGSKRGSARSGLGYSGTVFEPIDEFKGDLARAYFYMATRYEDVLSSWSSVMLDGSSDQVFENWVVIMLLDWHTNDPVSQKEIDRNDNAYTYQGNRNPFVDHPEWVACIWENDCSGGSNPTVITSASGTLNLGSVSAGSSSSSQSYTVSGSNLEGSVSVTVSSPFELSLNNSSWSNQVTVSQSNAESGSNNTVYVRFSPFTANGQTFNETISHTSTNASTVNVSVTGTESTVSLNTIAEVRNGSNGTEYIIEGVVSTPDHGNTSGLYYVQDATGGINVYYSQHFGEVSRGDLVRITGDRDVFESVVEIKPSSVEVLASNQSLDYTDIFESDLTLTSQYQGSLVKITGATLNNSSEWPTSSSSNATDVNVTVGSTSFILRIDDRSYYNGTTAPSGSLVISGVLTRNFNELQIMPFVDGEVVETASAPSLTIEPSSLTFSSTTVGEESASQSVTINGDNLASNLSVSIGSDFEISETSGGSYSSSLSISPSSGSIVNETIYVRFAPSSNGAKTVNLIFSATGVSESIVLSGTGVAVDPTISLSVENFISNFGQILVGEESESRSYSVSGTDLTNNLLINCPTNFKISTSETSGFGNSITIQSVDGTITSTQIYVRFVPGSVGAKSGTISHGTSGLAKVVSVQGEGVEVTGIKEQFGIKVYPNPVDDVLAIDGLDKSKEVRLFSSTGQRMIIKRIPEGLDVSDMEHGLYYLTIKSESGTLVQKVLIK